MAFNKSVARRKAQSLKLLLREAERVAGILEEQCEADGITIEAFAKINETLRALKTHIDVVNEEMRALQQDGGLS